jgi:hypothetical protein
MALQQANREWATRPADQRFTSLVDLRDFKRRQMESSRQAVVPSSKINVSPTEDNKGLLIDLPGVKDYVVPTHWSFGQMAQLAGAPADYLRNKLPAPIVADCLNYGLRYDRDQSEVGTLVRLQTDPETGEATRAQLGAATGPNYGRIWDHELANALVQKFGDGVTGQWKFPGEFGKEVAITNRNTTFYGSDRDMFVFLCDEKNRIELKDRRNGEPGSLARGFYVWNSEVGKTSLGCAFFLFDFVCQNRTIWGARDFNEIRVRHTSGAPDRWLEEMQPVLIEYAESSSKTVTEVIENARKRKLDDVDEFLTKRFSKRLALDMKEVHEREEHRPIETLWDATNAVTARARLIPFQDQRVEMEREAGKILQLAA